VALVPLLHLARGERPGRGALLGLAFGAAFFGLVLSWILLFGELAWSALVLAQACAVAVFGGLAPALWRAERPVLSVLGLAAAWTALEWVRGAWPLGGFTWGQLGASQVGNPTLLPLASWGGVWALTFVVALGNGLVLLALDRALARPRPDPRRAALPLCAAALAVVAPWAIPAPTPAGPPLDVAVVQVDVRPARSLDPLAEDRAVARMHLAPHRSLAADPPDLAVWGESALDPGASGPELRAEVSRTIRAVGVPTIAGSVRPGRDQRLFNLALLFDGAGRVVDRYAKVHLVPFGEYVPWRGALSWISALRQIPYDISPGPGLGPLRGPGLPPIGAVICFENSFPSLDRAAVRRGAQLLVVLTNNASYGFSPASAQHLAMSRLRAVETGRWVVHAAITGISAFVDPGGRVVASTGLFQPAVLRHEVRASTAVTPYVRLGDWVPWGSLLLALGLLARPARRRSARAAPDPLPERPRALVILPTYEERETVGRVLEGLLALPEPVDVLVVDDGSPDGTAQVVRGVAAAEPRVRLVERPGKAGLASAYLVGFRRAVEEGYDLVVEMDADLSHDPAELPRLVRAAGGHDLVIGSRYIPGGSVTDWSRARVALSRAGNLYARLALGFPLHDATSGYRVLRRRLLEHLLATGIGSDGYGFQIELAHRAWRDGFSVAEAPITFREREHGRSKLSRRIVLEALWLVAAWGLRARLGLDRVDPTVRP
jgi:apolipoprotein N-acyltransferase